MQLMTVASPTLEALKKEGEAGRRKINARHRYERANAEHDQRADQKQETALQIAEFSRSQQ